jgi:hypothetical protein
MLRQARSDTGFFEQTAYGRCATVAFASGPADIDPEPLVI